MPASKKFKLKLPEGFDLQLEFVPVDPNQSISHGEDDAIPIEEDDQGNLTWNGCGCGS